MAAKHMANKKIASFILQLLVALAVWAPSLSFADHIPFIVAKVPLIAGEQIDSSKLEEKYFYIKREAAGRYVLELAQIEGKIAKRTILPGQAIMLSAIGEPKIVFRGKTTRMLFKSGDLTITAIGRALDDGGVGDWIKLRNIDSNRIVSGKILPDGTVQVGIE